MTSNTGAREITTQKKMGFSALAEETGIAYDDMKRNVMEEVKRVFRPEFLNRIDEILVFHPLSREDVGKIAALMSKSLIERMQAQQIVLQFTEKAYAWIAEKGFDKLYGARPLRRVIQNEVEDRLAEELLNGKMKAGSTVIIDEENGQLCLHIEKAG